MALPFILGVAVGAGAVVALTKNKTIKEKISGVFGKSKEVATDVKTSVDATIECIKEKKAAKTQKCEDSSESCCEKEKFEELKDKEEEL